MFLARKTFQLAISKTTYIPDIEEPSCRIKNGLSLTAYSYKWGMYFGVYM
jgi:hypothetical protein